MFKNLKVIFKYIGKYPKLIYAFFTFNILSALFGVVSLALLSPFLTLIFKQGDMLQGISSGKWYNPIDYLKQWIGDTINQPGGDIKALLVICLVVFAAILLKNLFAYLGVYVLSPLRNHILKDMRNDMFQKILKLPLGFFTEQKKGEVMSRVTNDLNEVESSVISVLESLFKEPIIIIFYFAYLIILSPQLTLFLIIFLPVAGLVLGRIGRSLKKQNTRVMQQFGTLFSTLEETLGGMRIIKAFNAEQPTDEKFVNQNEELFHLKNSANRRRDAASPVSETLGVTAVLCILYYGGRIVLSGSSGLDLAAGDFLAYIAIFSQLINPLKALSSASYNFQKGAASIERIEELIGEPDTIVQKSNAIELNSFNENIELRNVSFNYQDKPILQNVNLVIPKGKTIALVGSSGAGKSTLTDLIPRFIDAMEGEVLIDGVNIKDYTLSSIRAQMGIVTQEPILFNDTIANNIALGEKNPPFEAIEKAAKIANAHNFIMAKENSYESNVGDRGQKLSGGERQRLTIARAIYKNPAILILDEATSSLDTESERLVQEAINNLMSNRTSIVIAHRLSTIRHADEIIVLEKGKIIERGVHESLMELGGTYHKLIRMQEVK